MGHFKNCPMAEGHSSSPTVESTAEAQGPLWAPHWAWDEAQAQTTMHFCSIQSQI